MDGSGDAIAEDLIEAACVLPGRTLLAEPGWVYYGGVDLSERRDFSALVVVGRAVPREVRIDAEPPELNRSIQAMVELGLLDPPAPKEPKVIRHPAHHRMFRVAEVAVWKPTAGSTIPYEEIEEAIIGANKRFKLATVAVDNHQAAYMNRRLGKAGVPVLPIDNRAADLRGMASAMLESFQERQIELFRDPDLMRDLGKLRLVERSYGVRLESPREEGQGHGDVASALAMALLVAKRGHQRSEAATVEGELLSWPA